MNVVILTVDGGDNAPEEFVGVFKSLYSLRDWIILQPDSYFITDGRKELIIQRIENTIAIGSNWGEGGGYMFEYKEVL